MSFIMWSFKDFILCPIVNENIQSLSIEKENARGKQDIEQKQAESMKFTEEK